MKPKELNSYTPMESPRNNLLKAWADWVASHDEWQLFAITVVFKAGGSNKQKLIFSTTRSNPDKWESTYRTRVLQKVRQSLEPNRSNQNTAIPYEDFFYYEFEQASIFKTTKSRKPHHIHGILPIRKSQVHRFWSLDENRIQARLYKDILSIKEVQSIEVQPLIKGKEIDWVKYAAKAKEI